MSTALSTDSPTIEIPLLALKPAVPASRRRAPRAGLGYYCGSALALLLPVAHLVWLS